MKGSTIYPHLLFCLCLLGLVSHISAQTITTNSITPASICPGGTVTVAYSTTGPFTAGNNFRAELSNAAGAFTNPTAISNPTSSTAGTISLPIPTTTVTGNTYLIRVVSSVPIRAGTTQPLSVTAPAPPGVTTPVSYCLGDVPTALVATQSAGGTLNWYGTSATGGTRSPTATPNTDVAGDTPYYVSQTINGCESPRASVVVSVKPKPAPPATSPVTYCQGQTISPLSATASAGGTLNWYGTNATGGTAVTTAPTPSASGTYYVSQTVNGCESNRASLVVTVNAVPAAPVAPAPIVYCENTTAQSLTVVGQTLRWYGTSATGGTGTSVATVPNTTNIGTTTYYVTQTVNGCESARTAIPVQVKDSPDKPGTTPIEFCQNTPVPTLTASLAANATLNWYGTNAEGGTRTATAPVLTNSTVGTTTYYVSQTLEGCESPRASLPVRVKEVPGAPGVSPAAFCNNSPAQPLTANGTNLKWFDANDGPLGGPPTPGTNTVGSQTFKVSQTSNEGCEGPKANLVVTIKPIPGPPTVANLNFCQAQPDQPAQNVSALTAGGQNLRWFNSTGDPFPNAPTPSISQAGVQTYQVSQTVDNCEGGRATLQVAVNTTAAPVIPRPLVTYCINESATPLQATIETGASARWLDPFGRLTTEAPTPSTLNTNIDPAGDRFFVYQIGSNGCYSPRSTIRVIVNTIPTLGITALTPEVNLGLTVPLRLQFTGAAPYSYTISGGISGTSRTNDTTIAVLPRANTTYQVTSVTNGCGVGLPGNPATASVTVRVPTVTTGDITNTTLCVGTSLTVPFTTTGQFNPGNTFQLELISTADTTKKYDVPATAGQSPVTATLPTTIPSGRYAVRVRATNPGISIPGTNSSTPLTVRSLPSATLTGTQTIYEGTPANLTIAFGGDGPWTLTYADSVRSYSVATAVSPFVAEVRPARTTTYRITTLSNSCGSGPSSGTATVSVLTLLSVDDNPLDPLVMAYPTPTPHTLTVELDLALTRDPAELSLINRRGQAVLQRTTRSRRTEIDLSTQPSGLYILRIQVGDRHTVRKVVKL